MRITGEMQRAWPRARAPEVFTIVMGAKNFGCHVFAGTVGGGRGCLKDLSLERQPD